MAFSTSCTTKGCGKVQEPYLDPDTNKVYCSLCENEISGLTIFTKNMMKSSKQFKKKTSTSFSVKCPKCNKEGRPRLIQDEVACSSCLKPLDHLSLPFKNMLKIQLKTVGQDVC